MSFILNGFVVLLSILFLNSALAESEGLNQGERITCKHSSNRLNCVKFVDNYDGDSITFNIKGVHPIIGNHMKIRVNGVDTAEKRTSNWCEKEVANRAQSLVHERLSKAKRIDLVNIGRGKYFRIVADVIFDGQSLSDMLVQNGYAYKYDGGTKPVTDWCLVL